AAGAAIARPRVTHARGALGVAIAEGRGPIEASGGLAVELALRIGAGEHVVIVHLTTAGIGRVVGHAVLVGEVIDDGGVGALRAIEEKRGLAHREHAAGAVIPGAIADSIDGIDHVAIAVVGGAEERVPPLGARARHAAL